MWLGDATGKTKLLNSKCRDGDCVVESDCEERDIRKVPQLYTHQSTSSSPSTKHAENIRGIASFAIIFLISAILVCAKGVNVPLQRVNCFRISCSGGGGRRCREDEERSTLVKSDRCMAASGK